LVRLSHEARCMRSRSFKTSSEAAVESYQ